MGEWKDYKVAEVIEEISMGPFGSNIKVDNFIDSGVPVLNGSNLQGFKLNEDSFNYVSQEKADSLGKANAHKGDVVITHRGTLGQIVYIPEESKYNQYVISQSQFRLKLNQDIIRPDFFVYFFHTRLGQHRILMNASQVGVPALARPTSTFKEVLVPVPSMDAQIKIMDILHSLDDKIEVNRRINDNLEQQAQALFKSWFVDFEPFKNGEFVESELGMIPKGWRVGKLGEICNVFTGKKDVKQSQPIGLYPFFSCSPNHTYSNEYIYDGPSIIIAGNGSYTGRTSFYFGKFDLYQRTYACTIKEGFNEKIISFLYYMMKCLFEPVKMGGTRGSSIPYIVMNDIVLQKFALDNSLVEKYSDFAYNVMKQIQQNNQESRRLAELRDTLLPKLMSGELKVNEIENRL